MDEILAEFIAETLETLEVLSGEVVAWEADPTDGSRLDAFFRFFHTVKGSCGFLNLPRFERLAHAAEDVLATIRRGDRAADPATVTAVLEVMDRIGTLARCVGDGEEPPIPESADDLLLDALTVRAPSPSAPVEAAPDAKEEVTAAAPAEAALSATGRERAPRTIRLPLALIDQLMNGISDMVLARNDLARKMRDRGADPELEGSFERLSANVADLRDMISKTRMQRVDRLYAAIPRMVRDLSRDLGKKVGLDLDGGDVEMDREMIEMVVDPLTHIVRNALDHGIEPPADRLAAGKAEAGTLRIVARQSGNQIVIEIADDGRGINRAALVEKAVSAGLLTSAEAATLTDEQKLQLIFHPGLSTAEAVTAVSGRGVGMDVVRANIEQIGGVIGIESCVGQGTTLTMRVPLTLTIIPGLIVLSGGHYFAMPRGNVVELLHQNSAMIAVEEIGGARIATIRGEQYSLIDIEDVLGLPPRDEQSGMHGPRTLMVVRSSVGQPYVLGVEAVESNEELVIRPASPLVTGAGVYAGMTLPDNGQPMLLLDAAGIAQSARLPLRDTGRIAAAAAAKVEQAETTQALLFAERDGTRRLIPLAIVDRVEDVDIGQIARSDGRAFIRIDGRLCPALNADGTLDRTHKALRLHAGRDTLCYLIGDVIDIIEVPISLDVRLDAGRIAGLMMVGETQIEMIDPFTLFTEVARDLHPAETSADAPPPLLCLIADEQDAWLTGILAPLLRQAGHDVTFTAPTGRTPDIILRTEATATEVNGGDVPVLLLADSAETAKVSADAVYRYDRARIMATIAEVAARRAA
ncbi:MAG TPA: chemotaxis protein CheA [Sphingobium sp.]|nr:chemotaxis protein CheA [Sphingobium sp.]